MKIAGRDAVAALATRAVVEVNSTSPQVLVTGFDKEPVPPPTVACGTTVFQVLSHDRYIAVPYENATRYGEVLTTYRHLLQNVALCITS